MQSKRKASCTPSLGYSGHCLASPVANRSDAAFSRVPVVLSFALHANWQGVVMNALEYTQREAKFILHFCKGSNWDDQFAMKLHQRNLLARRLWVNPRQLQVEKHTASILAAHLANFVFCEQPAMPCAADKSGELRFVLMAANQVLFRPGLEDWVRRHSMSFCIAHWCSDFGWQHEGSQRTHPLRQRESHQHHAQLPANSLPWLEPIYKLAWHTDPPTPLYIEVQRAVASAHAIGFLNETVTKVLLRDPSFDAKHKWQWFSAFVLFMSRGLAGPDWLRSPFNHMPHEGSFYSLNLMRRFMCSLGGSGFESALAGCEVCRGRCCSMYVSNKIRPCCGGSCELEELLLPTFVLQHHRHSLAYASPTLVMRIWVSQDQLVKVAREGVRPFGGRGSLSRTTMDDIAAYLRGNDSYAHAFGLKVPKASFDQVAKLLRFTLRRGYS